MVETNEDDLASRIEGTGIEMAEALREATKAVAVFVKVAGEATGEANRIIAILEKAEG